MPSAKTTICTPPPTSSDDIPSPLTIIALRLDPRPGGIWAVGGIAAVTWRAELSSPAGAARGIVEVGGGGGGAGLELAAATFILSHGELTRVLLVLQAQWVGVGAGGLALRAGQGSRTCALLPNPTSCLVLTFGIDEKKVAV